MSLIPYQTYKPINLQWLERVPEHWELKALKHCIARLGSGGTPESGNPDYWTDEEDKEGIPWVSIGDMTTKPIVTNTQKRITRSGLASKGLEVFPVGSLLYSIYASLGKVATLGIDATFNQAILAIMPDEMAVSQSYLCYWLQSLEAHLSYYASSNTQANLNAAKVLSYPVALPSQEEQLAISAFLDRETAKIDALIAEQQRLIELLQEKRQAVISHAVTKGLNPNAPMKDSGVELLGEVPEHWEVARYKRFCELQRGHDLTGDEREEGLYPVVTSGGINGFHSEFIAKAPGVVTGRYGSTGTVFYIDDDYWPHNTSLYIKDFHGNSPRFSWYLLQVIDLKSLSVKSAVPGIDRNDVHALFVAFPHLQEQVEIASCLDDYCEKQSLLTEEAENSVRLLQERRSALISAAVTGQIDVRGLVEVGGSEQ